MAQLLLNRFIYLKKKEKSEVFSTIAVVYRVVSQVFKGLYPDCLWGLAYL